MTPQEFVDHWRKSGGAELANSQSFLIELCDLIGVPRPDPTLSDEEQNTYVFEKAVTFNNGDGSTSSGRVDLYRRGCFVLESKQGSERKAAELAEALATVTKQKKRRAGTAERDTGAWNLAMTSARKQAEGYAKALPEWPTFLIVVDVGHCFDLFADFSGTGKLYQPYPDPIAYRIRLGELADETRPSPDVESRGEQVRNLFRTIWLDPQSLDPTRRAAKVTRELAGRLAELAKRLESQKGPAGRKRHAPEDVAQFLMRCLFTMFAEDVELIPKNSFTALLESLVETPDGFVPTVEALWRDMDTGTAFSPILRAKIKQFNGGLFGEQSALPLNRDELKLLIEAAKAQWRNVEPAIFGTLLERALDSHERHKLGAHYTPRAYVERLVIPTIIEPLREEWNETYTLATQERNKGNNDEARKLIREFHEQLCETRVLDPACGSGNFLYVSLELMKRLEGEVLNALREFGEPQIPLLTIDPHQFLGIEVNPRAAAITDLVLWIGYLQWHFRTRGSAPLNEPIIRKFENIECRDAVLVWDAIDPVTDEAGKPVTRWDGRTTIPHPVTGEEVPDETARVQELRYLNPRKAEWPKAAYIVGNPPFIGDKRMRFALGVGYTEALRATYKRVVSGSADYVIYWWSIAATILLTLQLKRFGFITTNSFSQPFNRANVERYLSPDGPASLLFAIPDHPWVDTQLGAAVRISMTVAGIENALGRLEIVTSETEQDVGEFVIQTARHFGHIHSNLEIGANLTDLHDLSANGLLCCNGVQLSGMGFMLSRDEAVSLGKSSEPSVERIIRPYINGKDLAQTSRDAFVIDLWGHDASEVRSRFPRIYQWVLDRVRPEREQNPRKSYREKWWLFAEPRSSFRPALADIPRYIATCRTAKHRTFMYVNGQTIPDAKVVAIASDDSFVLGVVSSRTHVLWAMRTGGWLGVGNDSNYNHSDCFTKFAFPDPDDITKQRIRELAEQLDAHRKRQQALHPELTMTGMYNVLAKLRAGESLNPKERKIHEDGLVSVLKQIHDELDAAVFGAYGWPQDLTDEQILERLVALNHERAEEESRGLIRWLRPEFQNAATHSQPQFTQDEDMEEDSDAKPAAKPAKVKKEAWPSTPRERVRSLRAALAAHHGPATPADLSKRFTRANKALIEELLETLVEVGQARLTADGRYVG